jgi:hypothetical protein
MPRQAPMAAFQRLFSIGCIPMVVLQRLYSNGCIPTAVLQDLEGQDPAVALQGQRFVLSYVLTSDSVAADVSAVTEAASVQVIA